MITLVIIGVIAAMTIPTLINKTNNQEYVSKLKKVYSTLAQATNKIIAEEGTPKASVGGWATSHQTIYDMYKKHLSNAKECGPGQNCFDEINYKNIVGTNSGHNIMNYANRGQLVLADGSFVSFLFWNDDCAGGQPMDGNDSDKICAYIFVDVNGQKAPNMWGRDAFRFYLTENGLFPTGCSYNKNNCKSGDSGIPCTCVALREGAMNY